MPIRQPRHICLTVLTTNSGGTISSRETTCDAALSVCRQDVIFCRRMKCGRPSHSALHRFLSSCSQKTGPEHDSTQSQVVVFFVFFFSFSITVSFPPLCLPHSNFTVVVPPLSFSFSLSICLPGADDQLS